MLSTYLLKTHHLPDSVTHPRSLMTCGCGLSVFISSNSDFKSRLSDSAAFSRIIRGAMSYSWTQFHLSDKIVRNMMKKMKINRLLKKKHLAVRRLNYVYNIQVTVKIIKTFHLG